MSEASGLEIIIGCIVILFILMRIYETITEPIRKKIELEKLEFEHRKLFMEYKEEVKESLNKISEEKTMGVPWLSGAIADYWENYDKIFAKYLENKPRPAFVQAERIKEIAAEKKLFKKEFLTTKNIIEYYEKLFPWLREYVGFNSEELIRAIYAEKQIAEEEDPVFFYVPEAKNDGSISITERNQKALERYWNRDKDSWLIGRDYERYVGYLYESKGFKVQYHGIERGKEDLGRDLVCIKGGQTEIIQCKYWNAKKGIPVRENHITQLYGTVIKYCIDNRINIKKNQFDLFPDLLKQNNIIPVLATTAELSETAEEFALVLGIRVIKEPMKKNYPCIKCNINFQTNERIYHLPFDQQYDNTIIDTKKGEHWATTINEAENLGFRRAWRWRSNNNSTK